MSIDWKKLLPVGVAIAVFVALSLAYFSPVLDGKRLAQHDIQQHVGMSREIVEHREATGQEPLWTGSMFSGMPAYQISVLWKGNVLQFVDDAFHLWLPRPASFLFLYLLGMYILLVCLGVEKWTALIGAFAFAFSSYFIVILDAGHNSKANAIGWMPPVLGAFVLLYRGREWLGGALLALFLALQVMQNHVQITYYLGVVLVFFALAEGVKAVREKAFLPFIRRSAIAGVAAVLALLCNTGLLWSTYEYGKYTTRGKSELTIEADGSPAAVNQTAGLDRDYVTAWSYGKQESFTLVVPNAKGGASASIINDRKDFDAIKDQEWKRMVSEKYQNGYINAYWGDQGGTSGPVYLGAIVVLLMLLALVNAEGMARWWALGSLGVVALLIYLVNNGTGSPVLIGGILLTYLLAGLFFWKDTLAYALFSAFLLTLMLSWGKNFMPLTDFFLDHVPGYDKFRAVTIILVIVELAAPVLGIMFLDRLLKQGAWDKSQRKRFLIASGAVAAVVAVLAISPGTFFNLMSDREVAEMQLQADAGGDAGANAFAYADKLEEYRGGVFSADAWRSFAFIVAAGGLLFAFGLGKANKWVVVSGLGLLFLLDQWTIDRRFVNSDTKKKNGKVQWESAEENIMPFEPVPADMAILQEGSQSPAFKAEYDAIMGRLKAAGKGRGRNAKDEELMARFAALRRADHYRVARLGDPFNDASVSFLHKSIGGYHGAKLKRYQETIEFHLMPELNDFVSSLQGSATMQAVNDALARQSMLNMLNVRYLIYDPKRPPIRNLNAMGPGWFVKNVKWVRNADEEIMAVRGLDADSVVVVDERYRADLPQPAANDPSATVELKSYATDRLEYTVRSAQGGVVVFSEVWYGPDWIATIDGQPATYARANYILRAMNVPAGEHSVVFQVKSRAYEAGGMASTIGSILVLLLAGGAVFMEARRKSAA